MKQRTGKSAMDIFAATTKQAGSGARPETRTTPREGEGTTGGGMPTSAPLATVRIDARGRPPVHTEPWTKVTTVLFERQVIYLDRLASDIRATSGGVVKRTEIIRALIDALADSGVDVREISTEAELKEVLADRLRREDG